MNILRLSTAGSVDDGKSTLIGRLLYDTQSLSKDKIENIEQISKQRGLNEIDFSLITDGLTAEREQGITIDVAHIYFSTKNRKYIIADTPGHVEYTRNMITGASNSKVFMILIDARNGIIEQTKRHLFIASLMEIQEIVVVINKMDLVNYSQEVYKSILDDFSELVQKFGLSDKSIKFIPVSAKLGDNVAFDSKQMNWFEGGNLLNYLENLKLTDKVDEKSRFNVQYVIRPHSDEFHDYRGYAGIVKSGGFKVGDEVIVQSTGEKSVIKAINKYKDPLLRVAAGESVSIELEKDIDISRGDVLSLSKDIIEGHKSLNSQLCWLGKEDLVQGKKYILQSGSTKSLVKISSVENQLNFDNLEFESNPERVGVNSINQMTIKSASTLHLDKYKENASNGYFILIDEGTNATVGVGFKN